MRDEGVRRALVTRVAFKLTSMIVRNLKSHCIGTRLCFGLNTSARIFEDELTDTSMAFEKTFCHYAMHVSAAVNKIIKEIWHEHE